MDFDDFKKAVRKGAGVGVALFFVAGLPLTLYYGVYGGAEFFSRYSLGLSIGLLKIIGFALGGLLGIFCFFFLFVALGASIAGMIWTVRTKSYK